MATDISICSSALVLVGADEINSFADESREAKLCGILYDTTVKNLLQEHPWRFSLTQASLAQTEATPLYGFQYAYQLPVDCLRVLSMERSWPYQVYEDKLYANIPLVAITYQFQPSEVRFPAYFVRLLELEMASLLSVALAEDESKATLFRNLADIQKRKARNTDSQQQPTRAIRDYNNVLSQVRL